MWKELFFWFFIPFVIVGSTMAWFIVNGLRQAGAPSQGLELDGLNWLTQFVYFGGIAGLLAVLLRLILFGLAKLVQVVGGGKRT